MNVTSKALIECSGTGRNRPLAKFNLGYEKPVRAAFPRRSGAEFLDRRSGAELTNLSSISPRVIFGRCSVCAIIPGFEQNAVLFKRINLFLPVQSRLQK